jgi:hypothetical protein
MNRRTAMSVWVFGLVFSSIAYAISPADVCVKISSSNSENGLNCLRVISDRGQYGDTGRTPSKHVMILRIEIPQIASDAWR